MVRLMEGLNDAEAIDWFQRMLDEATPGTEPTVMDFIDAVKAVRAARRAGR
jgi:hypothetical protein